MRHFRSLLINKADIRMPGLSVLTFAVHRHLPEHGSIEPHRHRWHQIILYLSGRGRQVLAGGDARVGPGTLVMIPPGSSHSFQRTSERTPLCLMIDFRLAKPRQGGPVVRSLNRSEITQVRQHLAHLIKLQAGESGVLRWESAGVILQVLMTLLRAADWLERVPQHAGGGQGAAMGRLLSSVGPATSLRQVVQRSGYQRDHLNRLVKRETGLTLGQLRTQRRLSRAKEMLAQGIRVANVAESVGVLDQSYFARWFRQQTGQAPSRWGRRAAG